VDFERRGSPLNPKNSSRDRGSREPEAGSRYPKPRGGSRKPKPRAAIRKPRAESRKPNVKPHLQLSGFEIHLPGCGTTSSRCGRGGASGMSGESPVTEGSLLLMKCLFPGWPVTSAGAGGVNAVDLREIRATKFLSVTS